MKNKKMRYHMLFILLFLTLNVALVFGQEINLNIKDSFKIGEGITFNYSFYSEEDMEITYTASFVCDNIPAPLLTTDTIELTGGKNHSFAYKGGEVQEKDLSSNCNAFVSILEPQPNTESKDFKIYALEPLEFKTYICENPGCGTIERFIQVGKPIYINFSSNLNHESLNITATLETPSNERKSIYLPTTIDLNEIGGYKLYINVSAPGYEKKETEELFSIIKETPEFKEKQFEFDEEEKVRPSSNIKYNQRLSIVLIIAICAVACLILILFLLLLKRR